MESEIKPHYLVKVVMPIYREGLPDWELKALRNNVDKLSKYPILFLAPEGLDISRIVNQFPSVSVCRVSTQWLGKERGIHGYNDMMMSESFYQLFADTSYILICHTDAWIFRDELEQWCRMGYSVVAAPWVKKGVSRLPIVKTVATLWQRLFVSRARRRPNLDGKIGNGGLSLRAVAAFREACQEYADEVNLYKSHTEEAFNEDLFWATIPTKFRYPEAKLAAHFAIDCKPSLCFKMNGNRLPMGCHGFNVKSRLSFWSRFIPAIKD